MTSPAPISLDGRSYVECWNDLPHDLKLAFVGSEEGVERLDKLAAQTLVATERERGSLLNASKRRMRQVVTRYRASERRVETLRTERNLLMIEEAILGEQQQRIADNAEVTAMIVAIAIGTSTKRRGKQKP